MFEKMQTRNALKKTWISMRSVSKRSSGGNTTNINGLDKTACEIKKNMAANEIGCIMVYENRSERRNDFVGAPGDERRWPGGRPPRQRAASCGPRPAPGVIALRKCGIVAKLRTNGGNQGVCFYVVVIQKTDKSNRCVDTGGWLAMTRMVIGQRDGEIVGELTAEYQGLFLEKSVDILPILNPVVGSGGWRMVNNAAIKI